MLLTKEVEVKWNSNNIKHYCNLEYKFTYKNDKFIVPIEHLPDRCRIRINFKCDYCYILFSRTYGDYVVIKNREIINKDACSKCKGKKQIEITKFKQENNLLGIECDGYWTFPENRLKELKLYIDRHGTLMNLYSTKDGNKISSAFNRYNHSIQDAVSDLGYNLTDVQYSEDELNIPFKHYAFFDDFSNLEQLVTMFIDKHGNFPTTEQMRNELDISSRIIQKHGGIYEIKRKMGYSINSDFVDDNGWFNLSSYEYMVAQYLIHNTDITYKREQMPFPKFEGNFRSDFTFYLKNGDNIYVEVWGNDDLNSDDRSNEYNKVKYRKIDLYNKYNLNLISIEKSTFGKSMKNIQRELYNAFKPYVNLKYKNIDNSILVLPSSLSDEELLHKIMEHSDDPDTLPKVDVLKQVKRYGLYEESVKRFKTYCDFGQHFNKIASRKSVGFWDEEVIFSYFTDMIQSNKYINVENLRRERSGLLDGVASNGGLIKLKLEFFNRYALSFESINQKELKFIENVANNRGVNIMNKVSPEQQELAKQILNQIESYQVTK